MNLIFLKKGKKIGDFTDKKTVICARKNNEFTYQISNSEK